jgi:3-dehydroquinate dehydratase / shikimate dehydrogenase
VPPPKLCVTVTAATTAELRERRDAVTDADLVELRLDGVKDISVAGALAGRRLPVIVTCRPQWEGGQFEGSEQERESVLAEALSLGAEYVDVEWRAGFDQLLSSTGGRRIVLSFHDFAGVPADLPAVVRTLRATGAEVTKVAVLARRLVDNLALLPLAAAGAPTCLIAMGEAGLPSRVLAERFGSCWTYAGAGVAPGQIPADRLRGEYGFQRLGPQTALYGVVGRPIGHSVSPSMHNAAFRAARMNGVYLPLAAADLDDFFAFADVIDILGVSVTAPYKVEAFERADESDAVSRRIRSVNTLKRHLGRWLGCNTDVSGFLSSVHGLLSLNGLRATVLGAGGAARAVALALSSAGARVTVCGRRLSEAEHVARLAGGTPAHWPVEPGSWELLVNATPVGMFPHINDTPLPGGPFDRGVVCDLVYNPPTTRLLRDARAAGCTVIGGLEMLVAQAQGQFEWWTGTRASASVMREAALARLDAMCQSR